MTLLHHNIQKLEEIRLLLVEIPTEVYSKKKDILSGSSIGQHFRHILEFYVCLKKGLPDDKICYDSRERNILIETDKNYARYIIEELTQFISEIHSDKKINLMANYSVNPDEQIEINSSLFREFAYALDHTVHHLAIIRIALSGENESIKIDANLGVAPSTIRFRKQCVQ